MHLVVISAGNKYMSRAILAVSYIRRRAQAVDRAFRHRTRHVLPVIFIYLILV